MNGAQSQAQPVTLTNFLDAQRRHRLWIFLSTMAASALTIALIVNGWSYYILDQEHRPFSPKHLELKPSGTIGLRLGILGLILFALIYFYPLRKYWPALGRIGKAKNWLDYHVMLGLIAPVIISFHAAFKIHGFAGMAYWTMIGLTVSGLVGRYFYAQIPRSIGAADMTLKEIQGFSSQLVTALHEQNLVPESHMESLLRLPDSAKVQSMPVLVALVRMTWLDLTRPFKVWALRRHATKGIAGRLLTLGGILHTRNVELEKVISMASEQASLSKRILFLSTTHRVFHLWHIVHRPFSLSFAIFVIIHVAVVVTLGYF